MSKSNTVASSARRSRKGPTKDHNLILLVYRMYYTLSPTQNQKVFSFHCPFLGLLYCFNESSELSHSLHSFSPALVETTRWLWRDTKGGGECLRGLPIKQRIAIKDRNRARKTPREDAVERGKFYATSSARNGAFVLTGTNIWILTLVQNSESKKDLGHFVLSSRIGTVSKKI